MYFAMFGLSEIEIGVDLTEIGRKPKNNEHLGILRHPRVD